MNNELQLGKYEFFPNQDYWEKILKELEQSEMTDEERKKHWEKIFEKFLERKKQSAKKKHPRSKG